MAREAVLNPPETKPKSPDWRASLARWRSALSTSAAQLYLAWRQRRRLTEIPEGVHTTKRIMDGMQAAGYIHMHEQRDHLVFLSGYTREGLAEQSFHKHMARADQTEIWEKLLFHDYLIRRPQAAGEYAKLMLELACVHRYAREAYTEGEA